MEYFSLIEKLLAWVKAWVNWDHKRRVKALANTIQEYMGKAQDRAHGAACYSLEMLESANVFGMEEEETAREALGLLCDEGILEYYDRRYYIKGNVPKF